jgi:16S rRNA (cytosine1402-N4)-methyltransferase
VPVALYHTPVLLREVLHHLLNDPQGVYVDATLGGGGHSEAILQSLRSTGRLIGIDKDPEALSYARQRFDAFGDRFTAVHGDFRDLSSLLKGLGVVKLQGIVFDLGVSSYQIDETPRGFSFQGDGPLDMRMDSSSPLTAADVVNTYDVSTLEHIFRTYGEERLSRRIARAIDRQRIHERFLRTSQLAQLVRSVAGQRFQTKVLARIFQALRIEVNGELDALKSGLQQAVDMLAHGGTLVVISYHSLEDRIVKSLFTELSARVRPMTHPLAPPEVLEPSLEVLTPKPVAPGPEEIAANPRARSAKLRAARRLRMGTQITA